jgi:phospholipid/cholesterol/gamma-HCH transport system permease protein
MTNNPAFNAIPRLVIDTTQDSHTTRVKLAGLWNLANLKEISGLLGQINRKPVDLNTAHWDLTEIEVLDSATALMLWLAWGQQFPDQLAIKPEHKRLLVSWANQQVPNNPPDISPLAWLGNNLNQFSTAVLSQLADITTLGGQFLLDVFYLLRHPSDIPWGEISISIHESGVRALGITALVGFLIGIVLSYLSALQLKMFGAEIYIIDILGLSIIRELGPLLAAILVAGRSGSAITAQIGIMRVTEELDALSAMGISHSIRLILPKIIALTIVLPLLSVWTNAAALLGGMFSAQNTLDISYLQFFQKLPDAVPLVNLIIGLAKSATFGMMIAIVACHFGFRIKPNTESLGNETTNSVVAAITIVIMIDAVYAILFMNVGMP